MTIAVNLLGLLLIGLIIWWFWLSGTGPRGGTKPPKG
jgi:plastocyanin domain-containing protein